MIAPPPRQVWSGTRPAGQCLFATSGDPEYLKTGGLASWLRGPSQVAGRNVQMLAHWVVDGKKVRRLMVLHPPGTILLSNIRRAATGMLTDRLIGMSKSATDQLQHSFCTDAHPCVVLKAVVCSMAAVHCGLAMCGPSWVTPAEPAYMLSHMGVLGGVTTC